MSETYRDVDGSSDPGGAARWQERMHAWPEVKAYKDRTYALLAGATRIVDIGSGPGLDVVALGTDRCVALEPSATMAAIASGRGAVVCRGDAHRLPFRHDAFDGARADRVFQHLASPIAALTELVRVVGPGGRIVIADPDQDTLEIDVPGVRLSVLDRLRALRRDIGYRNGTLIPRIPGMLETLGAHHVMVESFPLTLTDPADAFGLPSWPTVWRSEGRFSDDEIEEWDRAIQTSPPSGFRYHVAFLVVSAVVGPHP